MQQSSVGRVTVANRHYWTNPSVADWFPLPPDLQILATISQSVLTLKQFLANGGLESCASVKTIID